MTRETPAGPDVTQETRAGPEVTPAGPGSDPAGLLLKSGAWTDARGTDWASLPNSSPRASEGVGPCGSVDRRKTLLAPGSSGATPGPRRAQNPARDATNVASCALRRPARPRAFSPTGVATPESFKG